MDVNEEFMGKAITSLKSSKSQGPDIINRKLTKEYKASLIQPLLFFFKRSLQSGPQDQKSVIFSHSVISLIQLLENSKNTIYFLNLQKP